MFDVRAVIKLREHSQQSDAPNRPPAHKLDQAVRRIGLRRDEHGAAGEFAVAERKKKASAFVPLVVVIATQTKSAAPKLNDTHKHAEKIAEIAEGFEIAIGQSTHVRCEAQAQKVERIDFAFSMRQPNQIDGALPFCDQSIERSVRTVFCKIAEKGITGSKR